MARKLAVALVTIGILVWAFVGRAEQQAVFLKNGRKLVGEVTKTASGYEIKTPAGTVVIAADDVVRIEQATSPREQFNSRLAKIEPGNIEGMYALAIWAVDNNLLQEAKELLEKILASKPDYENAQVRLKLVEDRLAAGTRPVTPTTGTGAVKPPLVPVETIDPSMLLKEEDIYRIRLMELKAKDNVIIEFRNDIINRFIKMMSGTDIFRDPDGEKKFRQASRVEQARYILENTDRDSVGIRDDIVVKSDPTVTRDFKTRIWPIVAKNCAAPSCHGGVRGQGGLKFFNVAIASTDERVYYTNFYIFVEWARGGQKLVNRETREMSLLLQHGLPQNLAQRPHPKAIDLVFPSREDRNYRIVEEWIQTLRWPMLPPGYRVKYKIPGLGETRAGTASAPGG